MEVTRTLRSSNVSGKRNVMAEIIAGIQVPETAAVAEATRLIQETTSPLGRRIPRRNLMPPTLLVVFASTTGAELKVDDPPR
jgi:hypothetical protein